MMRSGTSLRMQTRIAVEAKMGSSPRIVVTWGMTADAASAENRMTRKPITAFQNPATIQGKVMEKSASST